MNSSDCDSGLRRKPHLHPTQQAPFCLLSTQEIQLTTLAEISSSPRPPNVTLMKYRCVCAPHRSCERSGVGAMKANNILEKFQPLNPLLFHVPKNVFSISENLANFSCKGLGGKNILGFAGRIISFCFCSTKVAERI